MQQSNAAAPKTEKLEMVKGLVDALDVTLNGIQDRLERELETITRIKTILFKAHDTIGILLEESRTE